MLTEKQKQLLEDKIYEIAKNRIDEWKKSGKKKSGKKKSMSKKGGKGKVKAKDLGKVSKTKKNTVLAKLDSKSVNKAEVAYQINGAENAGKDKKASIRSLFYKKLHNEKNDNGTEYDFTPSEINKIASVLGVSK